MSRHEDLRHDLPAYAAGRLEDEDRRRLEAHLATCAECADLADSIARLGGAVARAGDEAFSPHPPAALVRDLALGRGVAEAERIAAHVGSCPSCALEAETWRRGAPAAATAPAGTFEPSRRTRAGYGLAGLALAAGLLLGAGLVVVLRGRPAAGLPSAGGRPAGLVALQILRGEALQGPFVVRPGRGPLVITVPAFFAQGAPEDARYLVALTDERGETVWSSAATRGEVLSADNEAGVLTFLLPGEALHAGTFTLRVSRAGPPDRDEVRIRFAIELER